MAASSSDILCTLKHSSPSHRCSLSPPPSPLPFLSLAFHFPKLSVVFAINAKPMALEVEKHGEARIDLKPYHHWTLKAKKTKFVVMYGLTFFFVKFGPNSTYFVVLVEIFPARFWPTCHKILVTTRKVVVVHSSFCMQLPLELGWGIVCWFWVELV